jgi:hypothetical protein
MILREQFRSFSLNASEAETEETVERQRSELRQRGLFAFDVRVLSVTLSYASLSLFLLAAHSSSEFK